MANAPRSLLERYGPLFVLAVALIARAIYLMQYHALPDWQQLTVDPNYHHHWAQDIAAGDILGDTTYFRGPLYAWLLGLCYALLGDSLWVGRLLGTAIGLTSVVVTFILGRRLFGPRAGLVAGMLHAVYPMALYFEPELLVDPLYTLLLLISLDRFVAWYQNGSVRTGFAFAVMLGLAAITRPNALVMVPLAMLMILIRRREMWPLTHQLSAVLAGLAIVIVPVTVRNYVVADDFTLIASSGGINLYIGNNPEADGVSAVLPPPMGPNWRLEQTEYIAESELGRDLTPGEVSTYWSGKAIGWIRENTGQFARLYLTKLSLFFANTLVSNNRELYQFTDRVPILKYNPFRFAVVFPLAVIGLLASAWSVRPMRWLIAFLALSVLSGALYFYATRFRFPLEPIFLILAGYGVIRLVELWRTYRKKALSYAGVGITVAVLSLVIPVPEGDAVSTHAFIEAGGYAYTQGDYVEAWRQYQAAAVLDSTYPGIYTNLGAVLLALQQPDSAAGYFRRETELHPWYGPAWTNLAYALLLRGDAAGAVGMAREALEREPYAYSPNVILIRALAANESVSATTIIEETMKAAARTHDDIYLLVTAGELLLNREVHDPAARFFRAALRSEAPPIEMDHEAFRHEFRHSRENLNQQKANAAIQLAYLAGQRNRVPEAIDFSHRAIELAPGMVEAYLNLYSGYRAAGQTARADSVLQETARRFPDNEYVKELLRQQQAG